MKSRFRIPSLFALASILLAFPPAAAQYRPPAQDQDRYQDQYRDQDQYEDDEILQSVARVSWFQGEVSFSRGDAPDDWQPASANYPMTLGDRIWSGRSARTELQLRGATVYVGSETELAVLDLTRDVQQLSLGLGTASFRIDRLDRNDVFEVATPNVSVTFETPGLYRIDVDRDGNSRVSVRQGRAWAAAAGGQVGLERGDQIRVWGLDRPDYDVVGLSRYDSWDRWVDQRDRRYRSVRSASYVHADIYGAYDLDAYGSWENHASYGSVWYPRGVGAGWEPYRAGRWIWRDPWGWTWLSSEPWGWAPYHYGRWTMVRGRWGWVPVGPGSHYPGYSPALVGFVGGGPGWSLSVSVSVGGFVGWFPLGPREPLHPWWYHSRSSANVAGYNYAYRSRVTVVAANVFIGSGAVERAIVRDTRVMREISTAPVLRGPIPVLPTRESIRVSSVRVQGRAAIRPPAQVRQREVVTRTAPPPAPPSFERKLEVIRESGGEPVKADAARRLSVDQNRGERAVLPVRPAAREDVVLVPRGKVQESRKPQPLPPSATRRPVTADRPAPARVEAPPARAPEVRQEAEPVRPTTPPRRIGGAAAPPVVERAPAPQPEVKDVKREPMPSRQVPPPKAERQEVARPPERTAVPQTRGGWTEQPAAPGKPVEVEHGKAAPGRTEVDKIEPGKTEVEKIAPGRGKVKPTPTPKNGKAHPERDAEKEKKNDR